MSFTHLMLVTEGSEFDRGAERVAVALAARCRASLRVVIPLASNPEYELAAPMHAAQAEESAQRSFERIAEAARQAGILCSRAIRRGGDPAQTILAEARRHPPDLLIARRRGKKGFLARLLVGEMVSTLARQAPCPVLLVPQDAALWTGTVLAVIQSWPRDRAVLAVAAALARECAPPLLAVQASGQGLEPVEAVAAEAARQHGAEFRWHPEGGGGTAALIEQVRTLGAELVVLSREPSSGASATRLSGLALEVTGQLACPVLLCPASAS